MIIAKWYDDKGLIIIIEVTFIKCLFVPDIILINS